MKNELLTLKPQAFCQLTDACPEGREFAVKHPTMGAVWADCDRPDWLLWLLGRLEAEGLPDFARWCADRASAAAARAAAAARWAAADDDASRAAAADRWAAAAADDDAATPARAASEQVAEIKKRWGNPFRTT